MTVEILAGFDPGHLWGRLDLLEATRHLPDDRMGVHYGMLRALGVRRVRDGLPLLHWYSRHERIHAARVARMDAIWDVVHFDPAPTSTQQDEHFDRVGRALRETVPGMVCAVCEPSIVPMLTDRTQEWAVETAVRGMEMIRHLSPQTRFLSVDVVNGAGDHQYATTDALVATGMISTVGINYYPHDAHAPLAEVLVRTHERYGLPVMVSETGWHDGHAEQQRRFPSIGSRGHWLCHVVGQCRIAIRRGAVLDGVCVYPIMETPSWNEGEAGVVWPNGLIRQDLSLEPTLQRALEVYRDE